MKTLKILLFLLLVNSLAAEEDNNTFENISTFSGLSASRAKCIFQDSEGYLWIGTMGGGLNRYDGYSFTVYKHKTDDSTSLINNDVFSLGEDSRGNIWIATNGGISKFNMLKETFTNYYLQDQFKEVSELNNHGVYEVFVDSKDRVWFGTSYHGMLLFDRAQNLFVPIRQQVKGSLLTFPQISGDFTEDSNGVIWASVGASGLFWYDEEEALFRPAQMDIKNWDQLKSQQVFRVYADSENNIWVMTRTDLYKYLNSSKKLKHLLNYEVKNPINGGYEGELTEDSEGNMYAVHVNIPYPVKFPKLSEEHIPLNTNNMYPTDIFIDSFGIVWISDWIQGLHKYVPTKQLFHQLKDKNTGNILWSNSRMNVLSQSLKDPDLLFIGGSNFKWKSMDSYNLKSGETKEYNINDKNIMSMFSNTDGTFWVGIWDVGLMKWKPGTGEFKRYFADSSKTPNLANVSIPSLQKDDKGNLWIGAFNGLYKMSPDEKDLELIIPDYAITSINFDENILWIGTYNAGLIKFNLITKEIENFPHDKYSNSISNNIVWDIYKDNEGFLWLATEGGLNRFDIRTNEFKVYNETDGLGNDYVAAIFPDANGSLWMSTNSGISRMHKDIKNRLSFSNYDAMDGLMNPDFRHSIKFKDNLGRIYFGGNNGLYYFTPHKRKSNPPITHITDMTINGKSMLNSKDYKLTSLNEEDANIELNYEQNTLLIEFIALHYAQPNKNRYSYYLEGNDSEWLYSKKREVQYVNLDPGSYTFHLRSANRDGIWNDEELTFSITISEPWWNTWFAYLVYLGFIMGGLAGARQFELNRRKENESKKLLEAENFRKSKELDEARNLQLSMLPREIPKIPNLDIATYMKTATEVGGDYYDFNVGLDGIFTVVVGDATGHGMRAGTMVTSTKNLFSSYAEHDDIINTFHEMTRCIKNMNLENLSMCMTMLKIDNNRLRMSAAGMPPVYIYRKSTSSVEEYLFQGMPLGTMKNFPYEIRETEIASGDTILLMTDGFPELINSKDEMLGFKQTKHLLEENGLESPEDIIIKFKDFGSAWVNDKDPDDDVTFVVIKVK